MGGTSFDVCLIQKGVPLITTESSLDRHRIIVPMIDVHTIGAGGGSIAWIDPGGALQVGPKSAGSEPGPVCYKKGGDQPTVTDADVVLGYINPEYFARQAMVLDYDAATKAINKEIAEPLKMDAAEASHAIYKIVNNSMANAIRVVSLQRGFDPREFLLVIGGGATSTHIARLATELNIQQIYIPRIAANFCAFGLLYSNLRHDYSRSYISRAANTDLGIVNNIYTEMKKDGSETLISEGMHDDDIILVQNLDMRYIRQTHEITINIPTKNLTSKDILEAEEHFHLKHEELFGYSERDELIEIVTLRVTAIGKTKKISFKKQPYDGTNPSKALKPEREAYFEESGGFMKTLVYEGVKLKNGNEIQGPAIVEEEFTTIVVPPKFKVKIDEYANYLMQSE